MMDTYVLMKMVILFFKNMDMKQLLLSIVGGLGKQDLSLGNKFLNSMIKTGK
jgi:hypothetical protein